MIGISELWPGRQMPLTLIPPVLRLYHDQCWLLDPPAKEEHDAVQIPP